MTQYKKLLAAIVLFPAVASAQIAAAPPVNPVAFLYVSSGKNISAFAAASSGALTPVPGSPFDGDALSMAVNGKYLFATDDVSIYSYSIAFNGSLQQISTVNAQQYNGANCGGPVALFLDHSGSTLYDEDAYGNICANNTYQFFNVDNDTGALNYAGMTSVASEEFWVPLSIVGNNLFAYSADCYHFEASLFGFRRNSNGTLAALNINPPMPPPPPQDFYCPYLSAEDPTDHLAVSVQALNDQSWQPDGPPQLATYTAGDDGNLTTTSTNENMPTTAVENVTDIWMSPSGLLLAVGGTAGLQVFHFNGADPITPYTGLLTTDPINQFFWDNANHLYAISNSAGKLYVFTVTPQSVSAAPGSPYPISSPQNIIVLPKT